MIKTLKEVIDNDLCCNCGTCAGICPKKAIKIELDEYNKAYKAIIDSNKCNKCNICHSSCPGHSVDFKSLNKYFFDKESEDLRMGVYSECFIGYSMDESIRYNSSSGGVITSLLIYALERGVIDGALVTRMNKDNPFEPEPFIAKTREEIIEASKSKYCPVPLNKLINEILESDDLRIAVVGLPCHIHGIRKAEMLNSSLKKKIVLHLGIFCSHTDTFWQTDSLIKQLGIKKKDVHKISYRGRGWPGSMVVELKDGNKTVIPFKEAMSKHGLWINSLFRCLFCCDLISELSDLSFGDPWLPEVTEKEKNGKTLIICRTTDSEELLTKALSEGYIKADLISPEKVKKSGAMMESKKTDIICRFTIRRIFNKAIPEYNNTLLKPSMKNNLRALFTYFNAVLSSKPHLRRFTLEIARIESFLFKIYYR